MDSRIPQTTRRGAHPSSSCRRAPTRTTSGAHLHRGCSPHIIAPATPAPWSAGTWFRWTSSPKRVALGSSHRFRHPSPPLLRLLPPPLLHRASIALAVARCSSRASHAARPPRASACQVSTARRARETKSASCTRTASAAPGLGSARTCRSCSEGSWSTRLAGVRGRPRSAKREGGGAGEGAWAGEGATESEPLRDSTGYSSRARRGKLGARRPRGRGGERASCSTAPWAKQKQNVFRFFFSLCLLWCSPCQFGDHTHTHTDTLID